MYRKLSEIAYLDNGNFQEIVYLLKFKGKFDPYQKVKDETGKEFSLLERLCGAYVEEKKKNLNLPSGNNDKERKESINNLKEKQGLPVSKKSRSRRVEEEIHIEDLGIFVNG